MGWRDRWPRWWREQAGNEPAPSLEYHAGREAADKTSPDGAGSLSRRPDPDEAIYAEMAVMAARSAERAREEKLDDQRVSMMAPRHRLEYRRIRWEAVNAVRISGMPPQRIEEEYRDFRFTQWEQQNAERVAPMSPGERQEMFRAEEMLARYRAGLPPSDEERDAYREWRQLDADVVNAYREEVEIPEQLWDEHVESNGPLSREEFFAQYFAGLTEERAGDDVPELSRSEPQSAGVDVAEPAEPSSGAVSAAGEVSSKLVDADSSPGTVRRLPGPGGAGSGLEDGPMVLPARARRGGGGAKPEPPSPAPPPDPGSFDQMRPRVAEGLSGPVPGP